MSSTRRAEILVVANQTALSEELLGALRDRAARGPARFGLVVPVAPHADMSAAILDAAERMRAVERQLDDAGLVLGRFGLGLPDPLAAVVEAARDLAYDELVVCTLPRRASRWQEMWLPYRAGRATGLPVTHVVARAQRALTRQR